MVEPPFTTRATDTGTGPDPATEYGNRKHGGGRVHGEAGRSATFDLNVPQTGDVGASALALHDERPLTGVGTVLVVENEDLVRKFANRVLASYGYTVHAVADPRQAIAFMDACAGAIDLIVTDVVLPQMNGRTMATMLRRGHPESKVLYMSGHAGNAVVHEVLLDEGMNFLSKPFTAAAFARSVRDAIESRKP